MTMQSQISKYYDIECENSKLKEENSYLKYVGIYVSIGSACTYPNDTKTTEIFTWNVEDLFVWLGNEIGLTNNFLYHYDQMDLAWYIIK